MKVAPARVPDYSNTDEMLARYRSIHSAFWRQIIPPPAPRPPPAWLLQCLARPASTSSPRATLPKPIRPPAAPHAPTSMVDEIVREVCLSFGCSKTELFARRHNRDVVYRRGIAMSLCSKLTTRSTVEIGRRLGGFDHSTVLNIVRKLRPYLDAAADGMPEDASPAEWVRVMREHMGI
jgi:hypothetical protein